MSDPMQFMRNTGLQVVSLATSGRCLMQPYMLDVLAEVKACLLYTSNPNIKTVWSYTYKNISRANRILEALDKLEGKYSTTCLLYTSRCV